MATATNLPQRLRRAIDVARFRPIQGVLPSDWRRADRHRPHSTSLPRRLGRHTEPAACPPLRGVVEGTRGHPGSAFPLTNLGRLDVRNVLLGVKHALQLVRVLRSQPGADVYLPLSQSPWAICRDAVLAGLALLARRRVYIHLHGGALHRVREQASWPMRLIMDWTVRNAEQVWALTPSLRAVFDGMTTPIACGSWRMSCPIVSLGAPAGSGRVRHRLTDGKPTCRCPARCPPMPRPLPVTVEHRKGMLRVLDALTHIGRGSRSWDVRFIGEPMPQEVGELLVHRGEKLHPQARMESSPGW